LAASLPLFQGGRWIVFLRAKAMEDRQIILDSHYETELKFSQGKVFIVQRERENEDDMIILSPGQVPRIIKELKAWLKQIKAEQ
jgi:hypothetical protein